ncbi:hypothetical protein HF576_09185 [Microbacterium sp. CFH 90308]|uniref:Uncharacterized protein n=1 Tax=Microbacterium salsuginis TaxID=2722803 RepID=A0ABX1KBZ0_9MICO|nr:DUF6578 domain-containing protein [Microbacterium sp. CFH 90308]NLP84022.1 hypothetical protein [Microbacterium sp. CFH 90308]
MTRVWLTDWEWACCGDAFVVGDDVDFGIATRDVASRLSETLGPSLVGTVDAVESHHEEDFPDRVRGRVTAIHAVTREFVERRSLRRPGHGAPLDAVMPPDGEEWPTVTRDLGNGVVAGSRPSRYVIEAEPVPDSAVLVPAAGVRLPPAVPDEPRALLADPDPPLERRRRSYAGWLVDVEEHPGTRQNGH